MSAGAWKLADAIFNVLAVKLEADAVKAAVMQMQADGKSPEEVVEALHAMRDKALGDLKQKLDSLP